MSRHRGPYVQRGRGFGSVLSALFKAALPVVVSLGKNFLQSRTAKSIGGVVRDNVVEGGLELVKDLASGKGAKRSLKSGLSKSVADITKILIKPEKNLKRKASFAPDTKNKKNKRKRIKKELVKDIFE